MITYDRYTELLEPNHSQDHHWPGKGNRGGIRSRTTEALLVEAQSFKTSSNPRQIGKMNCGDWHPLTRPNIIKKFDISMFARDAFLPV
jgi:hypothetical protein